MKSSTIDRADRLVQMIQAAFACSQSAWARKDEQTFNRAAALHKKLLHQWRQAMSRRVIDSTGSER